MGPALASLLVVLLSSSVSAAGGSAAAVCRYDRDCNQRGQCGKGVGDAGTQSTCRCLRDLLVSSYPQCYEPRSMASHMPAAHPDDITTALVSRLVC